MPAASNHNMAFVDEAFGMACGVMGWEPAAFWQATPHEVFMAWKGFKRFHGLEQDNAFTGADAVQLRETLNRHRERQNHVI